MNLLSIFQAGKYECGVHTALGSIYATSEIIIHGVPGPPGGVTAHDLQSTDGTIIWTDGTIYGRPIDNYRIEGRTNHDPTWVVLADRLVFKAASAKLSLLGISFLALCFGMTSYIKYYHRCKRNMQSHQLVTDPVFTGYLHQ